VVLQRGCFVAQRCMLHCSRRHCKEALSLGRSIRYWVIAACKAVVVALSQMRQRSSQTMENRVGWGAGMFTSPARSLEYHFHKDSLFSQAWLCHVFTDMASAERSTAYHYFLRRDWHRRLCAVAIDTALSFSQTWHRRLTQTKASTML